MTADDGDRAPVPVSELSYTDASRELDAIVSFFEQREVDVDQLVTRLERATAIVDELDRRIRRTRAQVDQLVPKLEAVARSEGLGTEGARHDDAASTGEEDDGDLSASDGPDGEDHLSF